MEEARFYMAQTVQEGWSRDVLPDNLKCALPTVEEIESDLQQLQAQNGASE